jgi:DNA-binding CsgD family transcriptional regulator
MEQNIEAKAAETAPASSKKGKKAKATGKKPTAARQTKDQGEGRREQVVAMISRRGGATLAEIAKTMKYLPHTVRGLVSILQSKHGMKIVSEKIEGQRTYRLK